MYILDKLKTAPKPKDVKPVKKAIEEKEPLVAKSSSPIASKSKKKSNTSTIIAVVVAVLVVCCCCIIACGGTIALAAAIDDESNNITTNDYSSTSNRSDSSRSNSGSDDSGDINSPDAGDTKTVGDWDITLEGVEVDGDSYVIELSVVNNGSFTRTFSVLSQLELVNGGGGEYYRDYLYSLPESQKLGGIVKQGEKVTGKVAYDVDDAPDKLTLQVTDGFLANDSDEFTIK